MSNSVDPDETAHYEPSHLDLHCLQKPVIIDCGSVRINSDVASMKLILFSLESLPKNRGYTFKGKNLLPQGTNPLL